MKPFTCAVVGASGMVGKMFIKVLEERNLPISKLYLFASERSAGLEIMYKNKPLIIETLTPDAFDQGIEFALFGADNETARKYAVIAREKGTIVIDNSSAWRMEEDVPLVVPEVNAEDLKLHKGIIANPNCCAAPAVVVLKPLLDKYGLRRVVISTYQSVSGAGVGGIADLESGTHATFPHPIQGNIIPHIDNFHADGYTGEEVKLIQECRKMLHLPDLPITATCVRVPVKFGHSLSMNIELESEFDLPKIHQLFSDTGIQTYTSYPMPLTVAGTDTVHAGRIRRDNTVKNGLNIWVVADNTRKGAATNAVQILESLIYVPVHL